MIDGPLVVPAALDGDRVDRAISFLTGWPRAAVQQLIDDGEVLVDGQTVAKSHRLHEGNVLEILGEPPLESDVRPEPDPAVEVDVRFADDDVVVLAKPAGLVVHPGAGNATGTLVNGLLARFPDIATVGDPMRPGIVHRLDRDTSGLLVVARTQSAYDALVAQLKARTVERVYSALAWGRMTSPRGLIDAPIGTATVKTATPSSTSVNCSLRLYCAASRTTCSTSSRYCASSSGVVASKRITSTGWVLLARTSPQPWGKMTRTPSTSTVL